MSRSYTTCKGCGRPIKYMQAPSGKSIPCDTKAVYYRPGGPDRLVDVQGRVVTGQILDAPSDDARVGLVPHWATCPKAGRFKTKPTAQPTQSGPHQMTLREARQMKG